MAHNTQRAGMRSAEALTGDATGRGVTLAALNANLTEVYAAMRSNMGPRGLSELDFAKIKVPTGGATQWTIPTLAGEVQTAVIDCVVIIWHQRRQHYRTKFGQADGRRPPDCFSDDGLVGVGDPGGACNVCPLAEFGSGNDIAQACRLYRSLFILHGDNLLPDVVAIPRTSIQAHRQFQLKLTSVGLPCYCVVTRLSLARTKNTRGTAYAEVVFNVVRKLTPQEIETALQYRAMFAPLGGSEAHDAVLA